MPDLHSPDYVHPAMPADLAGFQQLASLALDIRWSWNHAADRIWKRLDADLWEQTHNPWGLLQSVGRARIAELMQDAGFREQVAALHEIRRSAESSPAWFQQAHMVERLSGVAYFSMEFMLSESLPIYSGGLGNVAGDQLKAAGDLGVPVTGIGLLYQQGYFRQVIDHNGQQQAVFPYNDPGQLPIAPVRRSNGEWLRFRLDLPGYHIWLRAWRARVGRLTLYLLDSNDVANFPVYRGITSELYGGSQELRLQQELVLGIGGWGLLEALGLNPEICHLNEGHAAFAALARCAAFMRTNRRQFAAALATTRAGNLFTTHTAVSAGFDVFDPGLIERYLGNYASTCLGISPQELLALGRRNAQDQTEPFGMAQLALHTSGAVNGVSRLHGTVSRRLFAPSFARWPLDEVPIGHVTNGVHMPSWDSAEADTLWTQMCGAQMWREPDARAAGIAAATDEQLWALRNRSRAQLVDYTRQRLQQQLQVSGSDVHDVEAVQPLFDPNVLTIGCARRFAVYKRPNLLLTDPERLLRLLSNRERPVQLILAGKAHPADWAGQALIADWLRFIRRSPARQHVVFLPDYDMLLTERLVGGIDVWLNTPRRPWEACGTSGMKVLVNGGLNLSERDGWWEEAYAPGLGWAIGPESSSAEDAGSDQSDADALYRLLEDQVVPQFYERDAQGIPRKWVASMRASMASLTPRYSSARTVSEYVERYYLPGAARYRDRAAAAGRLGQELADWSANIRRRWDGVRFGDYRISTGDGWHHAEVLLHLDGLDPDSIQVQLYAEADAALHSPREQHIARRGRGLFDRDNSYWFEAHFLASRPASHYTACVAPWRQEMALPLELECIAWQR